MSKCGSCGRFTCFLFFEPKYCTGCGSNQLSNFPIADYFIIAIVAVLIVLAIM